jgi:hypothetical protein
VSRPDSQTPGPWGPGACRQLLTSPRRATRGGRVQLLVTCRPGVTPGPVIPFARPGVARWTVGSTGDLDMRRRAMPVLPSSASPPRPSPYQNVEKLKMEDKATAPFSALRGALYSRMNG